MRRAAPRVATLAVALLCLAVAVGEPVPDLGTETQRAAGKEIYTRSCAACHGEEGDGKGPAAPYLDPKPRNLASGRYKIRTTRSGALPTSRDLELSVRNGIPYTSMTGSPLLTDEELRDVVYYVKSFTPEFANPNHLAESMQFPEPPPRTAASVEAGSKIYEEHGCIRCHGELGRGDGPAAPTLVDDWSNFIWVSDLTAKWLYRGGATREDLFRTLSTGLNGTPMPSYDAALSVEQRWQLVDYTGSLSKHDRAPYAEMLVARPVSGEIGPDPGAAAFRDAPEAMFPVVGQIMQPGRAFAPLATNVRVRAVYNSEEIVFLVQWSDLIDDVAGMNDPRLEVPEFDPEFDSVSPLVATEEAEEEGSIWGDELDEEDEDSIWGDELAGDDDEPGVVGGDEYIPPKPVSEFNDAVAIQLPMDPPTGIRKPYFLLGDAENPVDFWFFDVAAEEAWQFTGRGSDDLTEVEATDVSATAGYEGGQWSVIFRRPLESYEGIDFLEGQFVPIAFSIWDGFNQERGNKRGLTQWRYLYLEPRERESTVAPAVKAGLGVLGLELLLVGWLRLRRRKKP